MPPSSPIAPVEEIREQRKALTWSEEEIDFLAMAYQDHTTSAQKFVATFLDVSEDWRKDTGAAPRLPAELKARLVRMEDAGHVKVSSEFYRELDCIIGRIDFVPLSAVPIPVTPPTDTPSPSPEPRGNKKRRWPACCMPECPNGVFGPSADARLCYSHFVKAGGRHPNQTSTPKETSAAAGRWLPTKELLSLVGKSDSCIRAWHRAGQLRRKHSGSTNPNENQWLYSEEDAVRLNRMSAKKRRKALSRSRRSAALSHPITAPVAAEIATKAKVGPPALSPEADDRIQQVAQLARALGLTPEAALDRFALLIMRGGAGEVKSVKKEDEDE